MTFAMIICLSVEFSFKHSKRIRISYFVYLWYIYIRKIVQYVNHNMVFCPLFTIHLSKYRWIIWLPTWISVPGVHILVIDTDSILTFYITVYGLLSLAISFNFTVLLSLLVFLFPSKSGTFVYMGRMSAEALGWHLKIVLK